MSHAKALLFATLTLALASSDARAGAISGVCPDGSIFIVQQLESVPCRDAKRVDPADIPPLNPEFLPRPYGWDVFNRETDPNNPYNLIDARRAPTPEAARPAPVAPPRQGTGNYTPQPAVATRPQPAVAAAPPAPAALLSLSPTEIADLAAIIEVLQDRAPATLVQRDAGATNGLQVRFARSAAFEARIAQALAVRGLAPTGPVVAFHVIADAPGVYWGNLTFVQGHTAHHPDTTDPAQFGIVDGSLGEQAVGDQVLGYAVLPADADLREAIDVYWNDRLLTATLAP